MITKSQLIDSFPLLSSVLIEGGNVGQLWRMWTQRTAAGQNIWSYVAILAALIGWLLYYEAKIGRTIAYWVTWVAIGMIVSIIVTIVCLQGGF